MKKVLSYLLAVTMIVTMFIGSALASEPLAKSVLEANRQLTKEELTALKPSSFSNKAITYVAPYSAGGAADMVGRKLAAIAGERYGVDIVVENVVGGSGTVGLMTALTARPDGHTVTILNAGMLGVVSQGNLQLDLHKDVKILMKEVEDVLGIFVKADGDINTWEKFVEKIESSPAGALNMGLAGTYSANHASVLEIAEKLTGNKNTFNIPIYGGAARSITEIIGGHCDATVCKPADCINQLKNGEVVCIAYIANERVPAFPEVPTAKEYLPDAVMWGDPSYLASYLVTAGAVQDDVANYLTQLFASCIMDEEFQTMATDSGFLANNLTMGAEVVTEVDKFYESLVAMGDIFVNSAEGVKMQ